MIYLRGGEYITPNISLIDDGKRVYSEKKVSNEITFYIDDQVDLTPMKALANMTWREFVNSEYAIQNSMFTNFRLFDMGSYDGVKFYHEEATQDLELYKKVDYGFGVQNVSDDDIIENGKTYEAR